MKTHYDETMIIDKIKKLLALSKSPNEKEAASALQKAKALLTKYGIDFSEINKANINILEKVFIKNKEISNWQYKLIECITYSTFTEAIIEVNDKEQEIKIIGRKVNVITAMNLYEYLDTTVFQISKKYTSIVRDMESFRYGMVEKIQQRLKHSENTYNANNEKELIIVINRETEKENTEYIKNKYGDVENKNYHDPVEENSYGLGKIIGGKISLNKQVQ